MAFNMISAHDSCANFVVLRNWILSSSLLLLLLVDCRHCCSLSLLLIVVVVVDAVAGCCRCWSFILLLLLLLFIVVVHCRCCSCWSSLLLFVIIVVLVGLIFKHCHRSWSTSTEMGLSILNYGYRDHSRSRIVCHLHFCIEKTTSSNIPSNLSSLNVKPETLDSNVLSLNLRVTFRL